MGRAGGKGSGARLISGGFAANPKSVNVHKVNTAEGQ